MFAKSLGLAALVAAGSLALPAAAATTITPVGVTATNTFPFWGIYNPENLIDGSGLSGDLHDADFANLWMTDLGVSAATLTFDLGQTFKLSGADIWNYNFGVEEYASTLDRAANAFTLAISTDGVTYTDILADSLSRGTGQLLAGETFGLSGAAER